MGFVQTVEGLGQRVVIAVAGSCRNKGAFKHWGRSLAVVQSLFQSLQREVRRAVMNPPLGTRVACTKRLAHQRYVRRR